MQDVSKPDVEENQICGCGSVNKYPRDPVAFRGVNFEIDCNESAEDCGKIA